MSKVAVYYFTGTGNSRLHAQEVLEGLKQSGVDSYLYNISDHPTKPDDFDAVGIVFPVYCWAPPWPLTKWVMEQVGFEDKPVFLFANFAGEAANALQKLSKSLKTKGAKLFEYGGALSPEAWTVPRTLKKVWVLYKRYMKEKSQYDQPFEFGKRVATKIALSNYSESYPKFHLSKWELIVPFYKPGALKAIFNIRVDKDKCKRCRTCECMCPTHSIYLDPFPKITRPCAACYGCINLCPNEALETKFTKGKIRYSIPYI